MIAVFDPERIDPQQAIAVEFQCEFLEEIHTCLQTQWRNVASSKDKLNNLAYDLLSYLDKNCWLVKPDPDKPNSQNNVVCGELGVLWMHYTDTKEQFWRDFVGNKFDEDKLDIVVKFDDILAEVWREAATTKDKMQLLVYYLLNFLSDYRIFCATRYDISDGLADMWFELLGAYGER